MKKRSKVIIQCIFVKEVIQSFFLFADIEKQIFQPFTVSPKYTHSIKAFLLDLSFQVKYIQYIYWPNFFPNIYVHGVYIFKLMVLNGHDVKEQICWIINVRKAGFHRCVTCTTPSNSIWQKLNSLLEILKKSLSIEEELLQLWISSIVFQYIYENKMYRKDRKSTKIKAKGRLRNWKLGISLAGNISKLQLRLWDGQDNVDNCFVNYQYEEKCIFLLQTLNTIHPTVKYTHVKENLVKINFLDLLIPRSNKRFQTSVYRKPNSGEVYEHKKFSHSFTSYSLSEEIECTSP